MSGNHLNVKNLPIAGKIESRWEKITRREKAVESFEKSGYRLPYSPSLQTWNMKTSANALWLHSALQLQWCSVWSDKENTVVPNISLGFLHSPPFNAYFPCTCNSSALIVTSYHVLFCVISLVELHPHLSSLWLPSNEPGLLASIFLCFVFLHILPFCYSVSPPSIMNKTTRALQATPLHSVSLQKQVCNLDVHFDFLRFSF